MISWLLLLPVRLYQRWISPALAPHCRFAPSCSHYAVAAVTAHGPLRGTALTVRRVLRCHPWNPGGYDPVPPASSGSATIEIDSGLHRQPEPAIAPTRTTKQRSRAGAHP